MKRRQAIEPIIGHVKDDCGLRRCWLKGAQGDAMHAVLCAAGYKPALADALDRGFLCLDAGGVDFAHHGWIAANGTRTGMRGGFFRADYLQSHSLFIAPVYPEREYRVRISTPRYDAQRGGFRIAAQLTDAVRGRHALIAYADVLNRPKLEPAGAP